MRARVRLEVRLEYCSKRAFHVLRNARSHVEDYIKARCTRSPGVAGLVQRHAQRRALACPLQLKLGIARRNRDKLMSAQVKPKALHPMREAA